MIHEGTNPRRSIAVPDLPQTRVFAARRQRQRPTWPDLRRRRHEGHQDRGGPIELGREVPSWPTFSRRRNPWTTSATAATRPRHFCGRSPTRSKSVWWLFILPRHPLERSSALADFRKDNGPDHQEDVGSSWSHAAGWGLVGKSVCGDRW